MIKIVNKREKQTVNKRTNKRKFERDRAMQIDEQKEKQRKIETFLICGNSV